MQVELNLLREQQIGFPLVHANVDYPRVSAVVGSDHEALVARFRVNG